MATAAVTPWDRHGITSEQFVHIEMAEERMAEYGVRNAMDEASFSLFVEDLPEVETEKLRKIVMECRHTRQRINGSVKKHLKVCSGCEECMPSAPSVQR